MAKWIAHKTTASEEDGIANAASGKMKGFDKIANETRRAGVYITIIANLDDQVAEGTLSFAWLNFEYLARVSGLVSVE